MRVDEYNVLLKRLGQDSNEAYAALYELFYIPMLLFSCKYVNDEEIAKDLVQEIFIAMLGKKKEFENIAALKEYLYRSARNACINHLRHEKVKDRFANTLPRQEDEANFFPDRVLEEDIYHRVILALEQLPGQYRNVITYTLEGYKISEIARELNITINTAKSYKKEGKKRLLLALRGLSLLLPWLFHA
ncbi:MAG: sigma-70 family RNA polymerase sigma factor [Odoribacteraceae bacterium]|jgi:RNA polymerase sigma-70 factor (ECF subfamily)|nr:sigma-70 family RNA polymerase sigma factor [Odoribacteraceae bacterium]